MLQDAAREHLTAHMLSVVARQRLMPPLLERHLGQKPLCRPPACLSPQPACMLCWCVVSVRVQVAGGLLQEALMLLDRGMQPNSNIATRAIGYRQALEFLQVGTPHTARELGTAALHQVPLLASCSL